MLVTCYLTKCQPMKDVQFMLEASDMLNKLLFVDELARLISLREARKIL